MFVRCCVHSFRLRPESDTHPSRDNRAMLRFTLWLSSILLVLLSVGCADEMPDVPATEVVEMEYVWSSTGLSWSPELIASFEEAERSGRPVRLVLKAPDGSVMRTVEAANTSELVQKAYSSLSENLGSMGLPNPMVEGVRAGYEAMSEEEQLQELERLTDRIDALADAVAARRQHQEVN